MPTSWVECYQGFDVITSFNSLMSSFNCSIRSSYCSTSFSENCIISFWFNIFLRNIKSIFYQFFGSNFKKITKIINIVSPRCSGTIFYSGIYRLRNMYRISNLFLRKPFCLRSAKTFLPTTSAIVIFLIFVSLINRSFILDLFLQKSHIKKISLF